MKANHTSIFLLVLGCSMSVTAGFSTIPDSLKQRIDSLMVVANASQGLQRYEAEFQIAYDLFDVDNNVAVTHAELAYEVAQEERDTAKIVRSGRLYGQLLRRVSRLDSAIDVFLKVLPLSDSIENTVEKGRILNALALAYNLRANFDKALVYHLKCLHLWEVHHDSTRMGDSYCNIGFIYYHMGNSKEAVSYFERAIEVADSSTASIATINLALTRLYLNDLTLFPVLARKALALAPREEHKLRLAEYEFGFGLYYDKSGKIDSAESHFKKSLAISKGLGDARGIADSKMRIARCAQFRGDVDLAISMLRDVERDLSRLRYNSVRMKCYEYLGIALERKGLWKESLKYKSMQLSLNDSLYSQNTLNNIAVARVEFEERENELMILKQAEVIGLRESVIVKQRWLIAAVLTVACLLVGFVFVLYQYIRLQKTIASDLDRKVFERTRELQSSEDALRRSLCEQRAVTELVSRKIQESMATLRGLWRVGVMDASDRGIVNEKFDDTAIELLQVSKIISRSNDLRSNPQVSSALPSHSPAPSTHGTGSQ